MKSNKHLKSCKPKTSRVNQAGKRPSDSWVFFSTADQQNWRMPQTRTESCGTRAHMRRARQSGKQNTRLCWVEMFQLQTIDLFYLLKLV